MPQLYEKQNVLKGYKTNEFNNQYIFIYYTFFLYIIVIKSITKLHR